MHLSSNTLDACFYVDALTEAIDTYGKPEIMNSDHGSQFTGSPWNTTLTNIMIEVSMHGCSQYLYNIFFERLWRPLKKAAIYLHSLQDGFQAKQVIDSWIALAGLPSTTPIGYTPRSKSRPQMTDLLAQYE